MSSPAPLATVTRRDVASGREVPESVHVGHLVVVDADGAPIVAHGDPEHLTFVRSAAKPFQATACLELLDGLDVPPTAHPSPRELAVAWASHRAEDHHLEAVRSLLARAGVDEDALTCPPARPEADPSAGLAPVHGDCSGKHALFALVGRHLGIDRDALLDPAGTLQRVVLRVLTEALGPVRATGTDGCGAPAVAVALRGLAGGFAALAGDDRWARVRAAGLAHPATVGGEGRLETALLAAGTPAKSGAEGVFAAGWIAADGRPRGLAVKAADGAARAATVAAAAALAAVDRPAADRWHPAPPLGGGRPAGTIVAAAEVAAALAPHRAALA